jgi:hypothetical protein
MNPFIYPPPPHEFLHRSVSPRLAAFSECIPKFLRRRKQLQIETICKGILSALPRAVVGRIREFRNCPDSDFTLHIHQSCGDNSVSGGGL